MDLESQIKQLESDKKIYKDIIIKNQDLIYSIDKKLDQLKKIFTKNQNSNFNMKLLIILKLEVLDTVLLEKILNKVTIRPDSILTTNKKFELKSCGDLYEMYSYFNKLLEKDTIIYCNYKYNGNKLKISDVITVE